VDFLVVNLYLGVALILENVKNSKLVISLSKNSFLAIKTINFLIDLRIRDLKQNVKMSDQSNAQLLGTKLA